MPQNDRRGKFIVFEGIDGSGKTTQLSLLQWWLRPIPVVAVRQPGGTQLGTHLRQLLLSSGSGGQICERAELLLYAADRAQCVEEVIKPHLAAGTTVLCDRYTDSTLAYQGYGRGADLAVVEQINFAATGGLQSDLTIWLDVPVEVALARAGRRGELDRTESSEIDFFRRAAQYYAALARTCPSSIVRVDGSLSEERVAREVQSAVSRLLSISPARYLEA